jgi:hypothetical protein
MASLSKPILITGPTIAEERETAVLLEVRSLEATNDVFVSTLVFMCCIDFTSIAAIISMSFMPSPRLHAGQTLEAA